MERVGVGSGVHQGVVGEVHHCVVEEEEEENDTTDGGDELILFTLDGISNK